MWTQHMWPATLWHQYQWPVVEADEDALIGPIATLGFSTGSNDTSIACVVFLGFCGQESSPSDLLSFNTTLTLGLGLGL